MFWKTVKPALSDKVSAGGRIHVIEKGKFVKMDGNGTNSLTSFKHCKELTEFKILRLSIFYR